ncbi:MAG: cupin domain-containing protein [Candidatus Hydrogenedentes bacterium]|nr:cupin domain-containing protein [Candidatus Hydrogenedentota bacterium]
MTEPGKPPEPFLQNFDTVPPVPCPCGEARRVVHAEASPTIGIHKVIVSGNAKLHYHDRLTEHYIILQGEGMLRLNNERRPVRPGDVIMIPPGVRHALEGNFELINVVTPPFDPTDEHVVED